MDRSDKLLLILVLLLTFATIAATAWLFLYEKKYDFIVEAQCDPAVETCFYRDCSNEDDCPPNGYEEYKTFVLDARDFERCEGDSCAEECESGEIECTPVVCGKSEEDECAVYELPTEEVQPTEDTAPEEPGGAS